MKLDTGNSFLWRTKSIALYAFKKFFRSSTLSGPESDQKFSMGSIFSCLEVEELWRQDAGEGPDE